MNIKNKLLATLLILVFVVSIGSVVAEDTADVSDELAIDGVDESIAVSDDEVLTADEDGDEDTDEDGDDVEVTAGSDDGSTDLTSCSVRVDVLDKNPKVGDEVRIKVTVTNHGPNPADDVIAGFSFIDLFGNPDASFELIDDGMYDVTEVDGGYEIAFGFLDVEESQDVVLTFLATESGEKIIVAAVTADNTIEEPDTFFNTTITVGENSNSNSASAANNKNKVSSSKNLATGNPLALLAVALCCLVPYCCRK